MPVSDQSTKTRTFKGYAAEDIVAGEGAEKGTVMLSVFVPELTPSQKGGVTPGETPVSISIPNRRGVMETAHVTVTNTLLCRWRGSGRDVIPPTVRRGEAVTVYKLNDSDTYYWTADGRHFDLRQSETHRIAIGATNEVAAEKHDGNTYFTTMSSETGVYHVHTSQQMGEASVYDFRIDTKAGVIFCGDADGNMFYLSTKDKQVQLSNADGAVVNLIGKNIIIGAPEDIIMRAGRQLVIASPVTTMKLEGGGGAAVLEAQGMTIKSDAFTVEAGTIGLNGPTKIPGPLVAGPVRAEGYGTGAAGAGYGATTTDISSGSGSANKPVADEAEASGQRHCAAWEQLSEALLLIKECFDKVQGVIGVPTDHTQLTALAAAMKMPKNLGQ